MFDQVSASEAVKWAVLVFAAGFIGFFGKSLGKAILSVLRKGRDDVPAPSKASGYLPRPPARPHPGEEIEPGQDGSKRNGEKVAKKALKAQEKAMKKQGKK